MDAFSQIHGEVPPTVSTGVSNLAVVMAAQEAAILAEAVGLGSGSANVGDTRVGISSFGLYWDVATKTYKCYSPTVIDPSGDAVTVTEPASYGIGTYNLYVRYDSSTATYSAEIALADTVLVDDDTLAVVMLFKISADAETTRQYHTGVYTIADQSCKFIADDDTNITFTVVTSGSNKGKIKVNVYYK